MTARGELLKSVLFPKAFDFVFLRHSYYFIGGLAVIGIILMIIGFKVIVRCSVHCSAVTRAVLSFVRSTSSEHLLHRSVELCQAMYRLCTVL